MKKALFFPFLATVCLLVFSPLSAVETGEIKGQVVDIQGAGLPGVEITARGPNLLRPRTITSLLDGRFHFPLLPVGKYSLSFRLMGFRPLTQENVTVRLGRV
jgi:hypothetical protein